MIIVCLPCVMCICLLNTFFCLSRICILNSHCSYKSSVIFLLSLWSISSSTSSFWIVPRWFLPTDMLYFLRYGVNKTPHTSVTFLRILMVCIKTVFCNSVIFVSIPMAFNLFSSGVAVVPRAPTTNGTMVTFIFHTFFSSLARSKYLSIFSTSLPSTLVS